MYAVESDRDKRLIVISASGDVTKEDVKGVADKVREILAKAEPGVRALTDLRWMKSMESGAAQHIAEIMDMLMAKSVISVTRVVADPKKDIGFNILSRFHYDEKVQIRTFDNMGDALLSAFEEMSAAEPRKDE